MNNKKETLVKQFIEKLEGKKFSFTVSEDLVLEDTWHEIVDIIWAILKIEMKKRGLDINKDLRTYGWSIVVEVETNG